MVVRWLHLHFRWDSFSVLGFEDDGVVEWSHVHAMMMLYGIKICKKYVGKSEFNTMKCSCQDCTSNVLVMCVFMALRRNLNTQSIDISIV